MLKGKPEFEFGVAGESHIARWLRRRGSSVLPVYEKIVDEGKGPQVYLPAGTQLVAPDMLTFKGKSAQWIEAKRKQAFSYHRKTGKLTTGIDLRHYLDYCEVDDVSPWPVYLLFLHSGAMANGEGQPDDTPSGLYGNALSYLRKNENHRSDKWGKGGMVYWAIESLKKYASYEDVCNS